ncbi:isochorismatase family protein [Sneathiella litorea]|uniref:Isochorismatase family protein n=1 Tax=Sneathiella litorea TaxID=2606216 RepID=A0A6L8WD63_9PROT|nr:isochorismatase family protein [Sneathiella litorea]
MAPLLDIGNPALLIVDMQNDFVRSGAPLEVPDARATIKQHQSLISAFRTARRPIFYTKFLSTPYRSLLWNWSPECEEDTKCCWKGHYRRFEDRNEPLECTDIISEIYPESDDYIIEKFGYGAFHGTALADMLHALDVESVVVTGTVTQICVEETAREAFHHGFKATMISDAVSSFAPHLHAATLENFAMKFGWVATTEEVLVQMKDA